MIQLVHESRRYMILGSQKWDSTLTLLYKMIFNNELEKIVFYSGESQSHKMHYSAGSSWNVAYILFMACLSLRRRLLFTIQNAVTNDLKVVGASCWYRETAFYLDKKYHHIENIVRSRAVRSRHTLVVNMWSLYFTTLLCFNLFSLSDISRKISTLTWSCKIQYHCYQMILTNSSWHS